MKVTFLLFLLSFFAGNVASADLTVVSWNLRHLGREKQLLKRVAYILPRTDLIMIQEVNLYGDGEAALRVLADELSHLAARRYCAALSPRPSEGRERYAMLWNEDSLTFINSRGDRVTRCGQAPETLRLSTKYHREILREPAYGIFEEKAGWHHTLLAATEHLVPKGRKDARRPEKEVPYVFKGLEGDAAAFEVQAVIVGGDFNLSGDDPSFQSAKQGGFRSVLDRTYKSSLSRDKQKFSKAFDNIFVRGMRILRGAVAPVYDKFPDLTPEQIFDWISDHAPVKGVLEF